MHNKFCIIDDEVLITGSFNWSINAAEKHFENIVMIENDFQLVKDYLHEFEDLKGYIGYQNEVKCKCNECGSTAYNLGILGCETGKYYESIVDVWQICNKNCHAQLISEKFENYLSGYLNFDVDSSDDFCEIDKGKMLIDFEKERVEINLSQNYFKSNHQIEIHALGVVVPMNYPAYIERWDSFLEYKINIKWRSVYYRKIIPCELHDGDGNINKIILRHSE